MRSERIRQTQLSIRETQLNIRGQQLDIRGTRLCGGFAPKSPATPARRIFRLRPRTRSSHEAKVLTGVNSELEAAKQLRETQNTLGTAPISGLGSCSIRKNIIGRTLRAGVVRFGAQKGVRDVAGAFALLQEETSHCGVALIRHPLVHQGVDFLAEIRGVGEARKLEALQGICRRREEEVPRRFSRVVGHNYLRYFIGANNKT